AGDNDDGNKNEEPKKDTVPKTSDVNNMLPWVMVMALTAGAAVAFKKKEN
ncbi:MAG: LPXTG cell wall anchor domain-containing protein, partial [Oscillospiraceae bacterium]